MTELVVTLFILFVTHLVGGIAAFGSTLLALPLLLLANWELRPAVALLLAGGTVQACYMAWLTGRGANLRILIKILILAGLGIPVGLLTAEMLPERGLQLCLGGVLFLAGASRLADHWRRTEWCPPAWALYCLLFSGGVIHAAFASGGATLTIYGRYALKTKETFRGTLSLMWVILNITVISALMVQGHLGINVGKAILPGAATIIVASFLGHRIAERLSQERFIDIVAGLLCVAGLITIIRRLT